MPSLLLPGLPVLSDEVPFDPLQLLLGEHAEEIPGDAEGVGDPPVPVSLGDEPLLALVRELQVDLVHLGEGLLADDGHEPP